MNSMQTITPEKNTVVSGLAFSFDNKEIFIGTQKKRVLRYNLKTGKLSKINGHIGAVVKISTSKNGKYFATASNDLSVKLWNTKDSKPILTIPTSKTPGCLFFTEDSEFIGICDSGQIKFFPVRSPDMKITPLELLGKMEKESGMKLKDFYLEAGQ